jgi:periplasmic protein TonB
MPGWFQRVRADMHPMSWPVILSLAGHITVFALLILLMGSARPLTEPPEKSGIAVSFAPPAAQPVAALAAPEPAHPLTPPDAAVPPPPEETVPPVPPPPTPVAAEEPVIPLPPQETVTAEAPPAPPPKPVVPRKPKYVVRRQETAPPSLPVLPRYATPVPALAAAQPFAGLTARPAAASVPGPDPSLSYRALISAWLERHKYYPDSARERGEEGSAGLRFRIDRFGHVIDFALYRSTGYTDLDQGVEAMMNGAQLPPFPPGMAMSEIEVSVRIGFELTR